MNACTYMNIWQDGGMNETRNPARELTAVRTIADAETLKVLADPLRLAMLTALMRRAPRDLPVMSVKELAEELGEPQTKLYRHVKQLETARLIRVAATRMVSGILEQRYQACQTALRFGPDLLREHTTTDDANAVLAALFDEYRESFFTAYRDSRIGTPAEFPPGESYRKPLLSIAETRVPEARVAEIRDRLQQVIDDLGEQEADYAGGVPVSALIAFYSPAEPDES